VAKHRNGSVAGERELSRDLSMRYHAPGSLTHGTVRANRSERGDFACSIQKSHSERHVAPNRLDRLFVGAGRAKPTAAVCHVASVNVVPRRRPILIPAQSFWYPDTSTPPGS
jgi:hypothetical protein